MGRCLDASSILAISTMWRKSARLRLRNLFWIGECNSLFFHQIWGVSSVGRALGWQPRGQGFEPPTLHQIPIQPLHKGFFYTMQDFMQDFVLTLEQPGKNRSRSGEICTEISGFTGKQQSPSWTNYKFSAKKASIAWMLQKGTDNLQNGIAWD